jgi:hypothetical protein
MAKLLEGYERPKEFEMLEVEGTGIDLARPEV